jgi:hypothetical protein
MATKIYKQIFALSVKLILSFAAKGKQPNLEDFQKHLQEQGVRVIDLKNVLYVIDDYDEAIARISLHTNGGFQIEETEKLQAKQKLKF